MFKELFKSAKEKKAKQAASKKEFHNDAEKAKSSRGKGSAPLPSSKKRQHSTAACSSSPSERPTKFASRKRQKRNGGFKQKRRITQEALDLSRRLQVLSKQKRLQQARELYWSKDNDSIRDGHHACILIDCCARCGAVDEAENIVECLGDHNITVETQTALMKGYSHAGRLRQAMALFRRMAMQKDSSRRPNVRTLNTLLRGCLWSAATTTGDSKKDIAGGVVSSEDAWRLYVERVGASTLDTSSFEYSISLLAQALRCDEAQERIEHFQQFTGIRIKGKAGVMGGDQACLEAMAVAYVSLARAHALRGEIDEMWRACQRVLSAAKASRARIGADDETNDDKTAGVKKRSDKNKKTSGGKRAWKASRKDDFENVSRRASSNHAFRNHRLNEVENEALALLKLRKDGGGKDIVKREGRFLLRRFFYFSGGGTTDLAATQEASDSGENFAQLTRESQRQTLLATVWHSFGLSQLAGPTMGTADARPIFSQFDIPFAHTLRQDGLMNFKRMFEKSSSPVDIELGAGFGDWIARQAQANKDRNYIAVELRADRVAQILARGLLYAGQSPGKANAIDNLCVVGSECGNFLRYRVPPGSVSTIFANHPEPPTQTYGDDRNELDSVMRGKSEPAHMLNSSTIVAMARCLIPDNGKIVIVTDNRWFAGLLCATAVRAMSLLSNKAKGCRLMSARANEGLSGLRTVETFGIDSSSRVVLLEGQPNESIGHAVGETRGGGSSYFDRLWKSGAGTHAEERRRFIVILHRGS